MMATVQNCLITSFFKSPPKEEAVISEKPASAKCSSPPVSTAMPPERKGDTETTESQISPGNSSKGISSDKCQEAVQSDLDDYDSDHDDGSTSDDGDFVRKPLVINLTGLLSPEIIHKNFVSMATNEDKKQKKISEMYAHLTDKGQKGSTQDVKVPAEMTSSVEDALQMLKSGPKESNIDTSMGCMTDDSNIERTMSSEITDGIQECAKCPQQVSTSLKQSVLSWDGRSSQLVLGMPVGHASLEFEEEGESGRKEERNVSLETVDKLGKTAVCGSNSCEGGTRVADGREGGRKRKYEMREDSLDALVDCDGGEAPAKSDLVTFEESTREGGKLDDSFEDFIEARRQRSKRRRRNHRTTQLGETEPCIDSSEEEIKRPRRSAAVSAAKRILATMPQKTKKPSQNTPESGSDDAFLNSTSKPKAAIAVNMDSHCENKTGNVECVYESESSVVAASADTAAQVDSTVDDSVIFVSTSPQKPSHVSPQKGVNKGGLSAEWAEIFKRTSNRTNEVIELVTTEDEGSPKPSRGLQGPVSTRSPKKYRSSSRSPRRCSSPRRSAPHRSPAQQNSRKLTSSPLKQSHTSRKQLSFSTPITTSCDNAPFAGLVHVQQRDPEEHLWNLEASQSVLSLCRPLISPSRAPLVRQPLLDLSAVTLERPTLGLMTSAPQETRWPSPPQVCSDTERLQILAQLQKVYPDRDINGIYSHYSRIASLLTSTDQSDPPSSSKPVRNPPQKLLRTKRKIRTHKGVGEPLKCSIRICNPTNGAVKNDNGKRICVDVAAYENAKTSSLRRQSQRLSKEERRPTSEMSLKCSIRICNPANGEVRNRNNINKKIRVDVAAYENAARLAPPRKSQRLSKKKEASKDISEQSQPLGETSSFDQASAPSCKPGVFGSELWTEIYRPQKASEVIGNSVQVKQLSDWLREWKARCTSQRESASVSNVSESRRGDSSKKRGEGEGASRVICSREGSSTRSSIPLWVSEEDGDFVSLAHLRRRHCVRGPRFPDSSDTDGESSGGEEGVCPVTLLCGDHGSGKTAAVYACAQELGYKVFEVNSTSVRSRPNVLAILREATLSHQVATTHPHHNGGTKSGPITSFFSKPISSSSLPASRTSSEKKTTSAKPSGICAFFKPKQSQKGGPGSKDRDEESGKESVQLKVKRKKRHSGTNPTIIIGSSSEGELVAPTEHAQSGASVALATATVILLEEVDILFEEERGFWSAVYELIATTKRPIIMTCNDSRYELECDYQKLIFSQPSLSELSLHMQLLCLSHGAHLAPEVTNQITAFLKCDIRKTVTLLHFWLSLLLPSWDNETTAVTLRGESCGNHQPRSVPLAGGPREKEEEEEGERGSDIAPLSLEHLLGLSAVQRKVLKRVSMAIATTGGAHCSKSQYSAVLSEAVSMVHREGLELTHSLSDGPPSCEGNPPLCSNASPIQGDTVPSPETQETSSGQVEPERLCFFTMPWKESHRAERTTPNYLRLDSVSNMCDTLSCMDMVAMESCDSHMTESNCFSPWWYSTPEMSLSDELPLVSEDSCSMDLSGSVRAMMRALAMQEQWRCQNSWGSSQGDPYGLLVAVEQRRRVQAMHSTCVECANIFGLHWELSHVAMVTDSLPALQLMCHSENLRETANTQRRFRHYLAASTVALQELKSLPRIATFNYP